VVLTISIHVPPPLLYHQYIPKTTIHTGNLHAKRVSSHEKFFTLHRLHAAAFARHLPSQDNVRVFEVGCGEATFLDALRRLYGRRGWTLSGCALTAEIVDVCLSKGFNVMRGRFEDLPLQKSSVDVLLMFHLIEHLPEPILALTKAYDICAPGGLLVVETPNTMSLDARIFARHYWFDYQFPRHWYVFNRHSLVKALRSLGYEILAVNRQVGPMCWLNSIRNLMSDRKVLKAFLPLVSPWNPLDLALFTLVDSVLKCFTDTSRMQVVARKPLRR